MQSPSQGLQDPRLKEKKIMTLEQNVGQISLFFFTVEGVEHHPQDMQVMLFIFLARKSEHCKSLQHT